MKKQETKALIETLRVRFEKHPYRHRSLSWERVYAKLQSSPKALGTLHGMESSGGEPDVIDYDKSLDQFVFGDCSAESPSGRRSLCYDREALDSRKENKPGGTVIEMAANIGIELMSETQYRALQLLGEFDLKTSSWIATPADVRSLGGALFCDRRYGKVFVYHNGASSYYAARGFRGVLRI